MSTDREVQQVKVNVLTTAQYNGATKSSDEFYVLTDDTTYVESTGNNTFTGTNTFSNTITGTTSGNLDTNASNATSTGKTTIVGWGMPDYTRGVSKSNQTIYLAETDGWIKVGGTGDYSHGATNIQVSDNSDFSNPIIINDSYMSGSGILNITAIMPITRGMYYKSTATPTSNFSMYWYPVKGE